MNFIIRIGPYAIMRGSKELQKGSEKKNHLLCLVLLTYQSLQEARHIQQLEFTHKEAWYNSQRKAIGSWGFASVSLQPGVWSGPGMLLFSRTDPP